MSFHHRPLLLAACITLGATTAPAQDPAASQEIALAQREPRFLWVPKAGATPVAIDASRTTLMRRRVSLSFQGATVGRLLSAIEAQTGTRFTYSRAVVPLDKPVGLRAEHITVAAALTEILLDTNVDVVFTGGGRVTLVARTPGIAPPPPPSGTIRGTVTAARTGGQPVPNARVVVPGSARVATTDAAGQFRLDSVAAGSSILRVTAMGYTPAQRRVDVVADSVITADFALDLTTVSLDELVITGTPFESRRRTVPAPINVLTAADIEQKQATKIEDLLRGEIPGVMAFSSGQSDYTTSIYVRGNSAWATSDLLKIYIDGVEVANNFLISTIDLSAIERIEVVRGPQASTIYGSEASSGVLQIFTKKGNIGSATRPRVELKTAVGLIESDYRPQGAGTPMTQEHSASVDGGSSNLSYRLGANYLTSGEWVKNYGSRSLAVSAGFRAAQGPLTAEVSAGWSDRSHQQAMDPIYQRYPSGPACPYCSNPDAFFNTEYDLGQNTIGANLGYIAGEKWYHNLILGVDQNRFGYYQPSPNGFTPADTFVSLFQNDYSRRSIRYNTAYHTTLAPGVTGRFSAGVDHWTYNIHGSSGNNLLASRGTVLISTRTRPSYRNDEWWNLGYFGMAELGLRDQLFLTLATRVERNPNFGNDFGSAVAPRVGLSFVRDVGAAQMKLRAAWGTGTRPPNASHRLGSTTAFFTTLPNPEIGPEEKEGWDAGVELFWGNRASLSVTRYDELGKNLIQAVDVDVTAVPRVRRFENIGRVQSRGWEFEGTLTGGPFTFRGSYALATSKILALSNQFTDDPESFYQIGDRMMWVPKHSGGATITSRIRSGSIGVNMSYMHDWIDYDYIRYYGAFYGSDEYLGNDRAYLTTYRSLVKWNLRADHPLRRGLTGFLRVDNLANNQRNDFSNTYVAPGRTTVFGLRYSY